VYDAQKGNQLGCYLPLRIYYHFRNDGDFLHRGDDDDDDFQQLNHVHEYDEREEK
jgi:hypothetical protein